MTTSHCPCHSGQPYQTCCQPLHLGNPAKDATQLMRSRYCAYTLKKASYLIDTWHSKTRPNDLTEAELHGIKWLGLEIIRSHLEDAHHATVTFKAKFRHQTKSKPQQKTQSLHETSHFLFEGDRWFYVDGEIHSGHG